MPPTKLFCHCHFEGNLVISLDRLSFKYEGGRVEGFGIDDSMDYKSFVAEVCERLDIDQAGVTIKYTVGNRMRPPSTVRKETDFKSFFLFNQEEVDVYVFKDGQRKVPVQSFGEENIDSTGSAESPAEVIPNFTPGSIGVRNLEALNPIEVIPDYTTDNVVAGNMGVQNPTVVTLDSSTNFAGADNVVAPPGCSLWEDIIEGVGQIFPTCNEFRLNLEKYAMAHKFRYNFFKNDGTYVKAKCAVNGCPWTVMASKVRNRTECCIYKFEAKHVHNDGEVSKFRTSKKLVSRFVERKIQETPGYSPRQIVKDFVNEFGVQLPYHQAWRARELAIQALHGSSSDSYRRLSWFCQKIKESNPGSVAFVTTEQDRFHQCFIAFHASLSGFLEGCRPILFINYAFLKAKFKGILLSAQACDANNEIYPVAFGVVGGETFDWTWFLKNLKDVLNTEKEIIFISDRNPNITDAVQDVFGHDLHAYYFKHLEQNVFEHLRGQHIKPVLREALKDFMWKAASARLPSDYMKAMENVKALSLDAHKYLEDSLPERWAVSRFPRKCYDQITLNMSETFSSWIAEAKDLPVCSLIDKISINMMTLISKRHAEQWKGVVGPCIDHDMKAKLACASGLTKYQSSSVEHEVRDGEISHRVDLQHRDCTCMDWFHSGLPCVHACTVLKGLGMDPYEYVDAYYKREAHDRIYAYSIYPMERWNRQPAVDDTPLNEPEIQPPLTMRIPPGRPKKCIKPKEPPKRVVHCSKCGLIGHYQQTCMNATS